MATVTLDSLTKIYNEGTGSEVVGVKDFDLQVSDGEFLVFVGPSGCGKSTTLRCIAGLEELTSGDILVDGESIKGEKPKDRGIAMVFQNYALYPHMTTGENMGFGLRMTTDLSEDEIERRVSRAAEMMGISNLLDQRPAELSGGQQQRVALGRSIVREPDVFLLDEPLSNLDAKLRRHMRKELQELQADLGTTTIYVTHDQTEAMTMGDRIAVLNGGELQQCGTPLDCYHEPANRFVADFIGEPSMNFVDVVRDGRTLRRPGDDSFTYTLPEEIASKLQATTDIELGIRPEHIELAEETGPDTATAEIRVVEPLGNSNVVHLEIGDVDFVLTLDENIPLKTDDVVRLSLPPNRIYIFDSNTGETLVTGERSEGELPASVRMASG